MQGREAARARGRKGAKAQGRKGARKGGRAKTTDQRARANEEVMP